MSINIVDKNEQKLLGRTLVRATLSYEGTTPSRKQVRAELSKALKEKEENVIVQHIYTSYGGNEADIHAAVYKNLEDAKAVEHKKLMEKHVVKEEKKEEEKPSEAPAEDKKDEGSEEKKEEAPAEEKKE